MPDSGSDSEIEPISARPTSSSAGPSRPRSNLPTSVPNNSTPATASGSHAAQKQAQDGATAVRKVHKVGAWATASTSASSSSIAPSNATASSNAGPAAPINSASAVKSKTMGTTPGQALNGTAVPDRKGKGKARATEVLILDSSDDDHSSGSPIVVQRKPPRASMPSATSSVQSRTSKEPARRHSLAHHKSSTAQAAAGTSSSEPDPLMLAPRATGSDRSMDRPADKPASQVGNGVKIGDTVVRKNTTARKSTGGKIPIQKTAAAGAPSTSIVPPPYAATGPTSSAKPPLSQSIRRPPDGRTQKGNGPSSSSIPQRPRPPSGTGTAPSSTSRLTSTSSSSNTAVKAGESTSTSLSPSKPTSSAATSAARRPAGTAPPRRQPIVQNPAQSNSPDTLAYKTGHKKNATAASDAFSAPRGTKAAPQPSQPAPPASTSSELSTDAARPAGKPASSHSAAGSQSARSRPSSDGKIPRTPVQGGALASATASNGNGPLTTTRAPPTASSSQPSRARAGPVMIVDSDSDIEIISPRRKSPAAPPRPAFYSQTASKSREDGLSAQQNVVSGIDMTMRDATATTKTAVKAAGPATATVESARSPEAKITPKIGTGPPQHASSPREDARAEGEDRPASGDEPEIEDDELFSDEDGDDESMETNGRKLSKRRKRRPAHMKEYQIFPGGRKGRHKPTTAEGEYVQTSVAIGENCARPDGVNSGAVQKANAGLSATAAPHDAQDSPLERGAGSTRQAASSVDRGCAVASIARFSKRLPSVEMTAEDLDKLKLSDSAATTDREPEQPKTVPRLAPVPSGPSSAQQAVAGKAGGAPTLVEDVEMSDARPASDTSKGDKQNASNPSSTSSSPAPEHSQPRQAKLGRGRKSTGRRPPQAQILSTQARRLAAELAALRTAEQGVDHAGASGASGASNASFTSADADEREDSGRSSRGGSHTSTVSSTAPTSASAVKAVPVGLDQSLPDVPMAEIESAAGSGAETTTGSEAPIRAFTTARKSDGRRMIVQSSPSVVGDSEINSASASDEDSDEESPSADDADRVAEGNGQIQGPEGPDSETARASTLETAAKQSMPISIRDGLVRRAGAARKSYGPKPPRPRSDSCPNIDPVELDRKTNEASDHSDLTDLSDSATDDSLPDVQSRRAKQAALKIRAAHESLSAARARRQAGAARAPETSPTPLAVDGMTNNDDLSRRASKLSVQEVNEDRRQSRHRRSRRSSASLSEAQSDDETSTKARPSKRRQTEMPGSGIHSIDLVKLIREEKLPLILTPADIDRSDPAALEEQRDLIVKFKEREKRKHPWQRQICGPSYDFSSEFHTEIQDAVNRREKRWAKLHPDELPIRSEYRAMFEAMIIEALSLEYPPLAIDARPKIRVCPPTDLPPEAMPTPPFDFIYTNRVVYDEDIAPVQAPGCGCKGDCNSAENRRSCSCLARQIKACTTKVGGTDRSDHKDFAYDRHGRLKWRVFETHDQIIECNSMCGCGPECINRVVGNRKSISVDIFWTGIAGWGVRLPPSYPGHYQRTIKRGEPLAIYAGELLRTNNAYQRDDHVYSVIGRNYIYDLDAWTVMEDVETLLIRNTVADLKAKTPPPADSQIKTTQKNKGKKGEGKKNTVLEELQLIEDSKSISPLYSMDAFNMGNWTRFCNHVCADWNTKTRPVYIDEADLSRPLFVYFACRDIQPAEEITITYFGGDDEVEDKNLGYTDAEWKVLADKVREEAPPGHRCYCGKKLCRGRMFDVPADEPMFWQVPNS